MSASIRVVLAGAPLLMLLTGCKLVAAIGILGAPRQIQKAEYKLTNQRLAVLIETAVPGQDNPVFAQALHDKLVEIFREEDINQRIVPRREMLELRRDHPDFTRWSLQRIGRELNAQQVLYVRIEHLQIRAAPDHPLLEPRVRARLKVIAVNELGDQARLWPPAAERDGRAVEWQRQPREAESAMTVDTEAAKLAREFAWRVAEPFYDVDLEDDPPRE